MRTRTIRPTTFEPTAFAFAVRAESLVVNAGRRRAVDGLDLALGTGVHGLLGPNGAGKTTLMRALSTVSRPGGGALELLGVPMSPDADLAVVRRRLGYLPQHFGFHPRFTVRELVEYFAWLKEVPSQRIGPAAQRAIERVGLADRAGDKMKTLSGGMVRRVGMAQAIVNDPDLLLLDEPTTGLDPEQRVSFRELLRDLGSDACVLVSTHLVEDVAASCEDVVLMESGRSVFAGSLDGLLAADPGASSGTVGDSAVERAYTALLRSARATGEGA
ncbi:ATP-binding cassette domain-containing protein [Motilibacter deserti]|uniref:ATP-binding cassette domain-containing protein n=1 Tax=Motilibacter deserti TaxID=2714956 RepID=UPI0018C880A3|nr:ATP-binding cassette domain-containing protein [Motilibacter deserti]